MSSIHLKIESKMYLKIQTTFWCNFLFLPLIGNNSNLQEWRHIEHANQHCSRHDVKLGKEENQSRGQTSKNWIHKIFKAQRENCWRELLSFIYFPMYYIDSWSDSRNEYYFDSWWDQLNESCLNHWRMRHRHWYQK